jgi:hypothetical protein
LRPIKFLADKGKSGIDHIDRLIGDKGKKKRKREKAAKQGNATK